MHCTSASRQRNLAITTGERGNLDGATFYHGEVYHSVQAYRFKDRVITEIFLSYFFSPFPSSFLSFFLSFFLAKITSKFEGSTIFIPLELEMYRTCERSFHEKKLLNATLLFYEGWQRNKGELIPLETRGTRSLFEGSACPDEKIQRFLDKSMVRTFLNRCNIYISIRLIFNTTNVRPSIYYLIFAGKWTRNFDRSIVLVVCVLSRLLLPHPLKIYETTTEKCCTLFEKGNMFLGVHIRIYTERGSWYAT